GRWRIGRTPDAPPHSRIASQYRTSDRTERSAPYGGILNTQFRKPLPGTNLDYFDVRAAVEALAPGAYDQLPYTSRVLGENLLRRCDPALLNDALRQLIERRRDLDFPWYPTRVVCHDILGQTALVDP